jgi:hypothetical protein
MGNMSEEFQESNVCESCRSPKAKSKCEECARAICKECVLNPPPGAFHLLPRIPKELSHRIYCRFCFDDLVEPKLESYFEILERAKQVFIFFKTQRKEIPLIRKSKTSFKVEDCDDRDETILRLAYQAAEQDYNAVIETEVLATKVRNHGYQTSRWRGMGVAALVDAERIDRQELENKTYR